MIQVIMDELFMSKFVSEALRWSLSWAPVLCSSLFPFLFRVIASPCGFLLASLYLRRKGPLWTHVFSSFILFSSLFWKVCVCSAKGDTPLDPRVSSFSFNCKSVFISFSFLLHVGYRTVLCFSLNSKSFYLCLSKLLASLFLQR